MTRTEVDRLAQTLWHYHHLNLPVEKTDCIIGLGSYDLRVAARCVDLYKNNWAPLIIFSGCAGNWTRGLWDDSEAEMFARHAIAEGVPAGKLKLESKSTNIGENIRFTKELLATESIHPGSVTIVTKPSTERRVFATCRLLWPEMKIFITSPKIEFHEQKEGGGHDRLIHEMVGDTQRMRVYPALGFQIPQEIPTDVWSAYETLVSLGYDKHLIKAAPPGPLQNDRSSQ